VLQFGSQGERTGCDVYHTLWWKTSHRTFVIRAWGEKRTCEILRRYSNSY